MALWKSVWYVQFCIYFHRQSTTSFCWIVMKSNALIKWYSHFDDWTYCMYSSSILTCTVTVNVNITCALHLTDQFTLVEIHAPTVTICPFAHNNKIISNVQYALGWINCSAIFSFVTFSVTAPPCWEFKTPLLFFVACYFWSQLALEMRCYCWMWTVNQSCHWLTHFV